MAAAYRSFRTALERRAGHEVAAQLTRATLQRYAAVGRLAAGQGTDRLAAVPAMDRYLVAALRSVTVPAPDASGAAVVAVLVEHGLLRATPEGAGQLSAAEVEVAEGSGRATAAIAPGAAVRWEFRHEGGAWRLDLLPEFAIGSMVLESVAAGRTTSVEALVQELLSEALGRPVGPEVWHPRR